MKTLIASLVLTASAVLATHDARPVQECCIEATGSPRLEPMAAAKTEKSGAGGLGAGCFAHLFM